MPHSQFRPEPSLIPIQRPPCPMCQGRMMLTLIVPGPAHFDTRTFECSKCEHVHQVLVEDPLQPANTSWMAAGLKPPE